MIAICPNPFRDIGLNITRQAVDILRSAGFETAVCPAAKLKQVRQSFVHERAAGDKNSVTAGENIVARGVGVIPRLRVALYYKHFFCLGVYLRRQTEVAYHADGHAAEGETCRAVVFKRLRTLK